MIISRPCDYCQQIYNADTRYLNRNQGQYCSRSCSGKNKSKNTPKPSPNVECALCGKSFYLKQSRRNSSKSGLFFCSKAHQDEGYKQSIIKPGPKTDIAVRTCDHCGKRWQSRYNTITLP